MSNRIQYTVGSDKRSKTIVTNTGTTQGTVLSPILFSIYTNCLRAQNDNVRVVKYADDTCIIGQISCTDDLDNYFSDVMNIVSVCTDMNLLLNATKTHEMVFTTARKQPATPNLILSGITIDL